MDRTSLGRSLQPVVRRGLASVLRAQDDHRSRHIRLTQKGEAILAHAYAGWRVAQADFERSFGEAEALRLRTELLRIASAESISEMAERLRANARRLASTERLNFTRKRK